MSEKEERFLNLIITYFKENKVMPTFKYLKKELGYQSNNSITQYYKSLEKKGYLKRNNLNNLVINDNSILNINLKRITIINQRTKTIEISLDKRKNYVAYKMNHDYFKKNGIFKNDILIIEKNKKIKSNSLALFKINQQYRVMKYNYKDGFYLLNDNQTIILHQVNIIGKVIQIIRYI